MNKNIVWVKAKATDYYRAIKKIELIGIKVYDIKYKNKYLYLKIDLESLEKLDKYLVSYKFSIVDKLGFAKVIELIKREKILVIAFIIGFSLFMVLKNLIVEVNVIHENKEIRELILDELDTYGIKVLSFKKSYKKLDKIRQEILDKYPEDLDWMEFEVKGMKINVKVEERIITNINKEDKVCDLIAKKNGVINELVIYNGEANVAINDYVREGDILVKGIVLYNAEEKRHTCASGEVYATTWYTASVSIPFEHIEYKKTGKKRYNLVWESNGNKKNIFRSRFENYESDLQNIFRAFQYKLYIDKEYEVEKNKEVYTEEEALKKGIEKAEESILKKLGDKDKIIDKKVLQKQVNDSKMDIEVFIIVKELISMENIVENTKEN